MLAWIILLLMPVALLAIAVAVSLARTDTGNRKLKLYAIALSIGVVALLAVVYLTVQEIWPGGWGPALASTAVGLLALYVMERKLGRRSGPDLPQA